MLYCNQEGKMSPTKIDTIWNAEPHTIAKIKILQSYFYVWVEIFGRSWRGQNLLYVDGFAGPGKYKNYDKGSPVAAIEAAKAALSSVGDKWVAGEVNCAFIELDTKRFTHLEAVLKSIPKHSKLKIHSFNTSFVDGLSELRVQFPDAFQTQPLFVFIDPFGPKGVPFAEVADILKSPRSEVLVNFDADGVIRILKAKNDAILNRIYGGTSWEGKLSKDKGFDVLCREALNLYKENLRSLPNVKYIFSFEMRAYPNTPNYSLVFASQHPKGLEKMKEAMKKMDQNGTYSFSDTNLNQTSLFRFNQSEEYAMKMHEQYKGKDAGYHELQDYALNETPFIDPKSMLRNLENKNLIHVVSSDPKRRKGTFNEKKIQKIVFLKRGENA